MIISGVLIKLSFKKIYKVVGLNYQDLGQINNFCKRA